MNQPLTKQALDVEFAKVYAINDELQHGLSLAQLCRQLEESHGVPKETIESLYSIYRQEQSLPRFANRFLTRLRRLSIAPEAIRNIAIFTLIGGAINFAWARFEAHKHFANEQWIIAESGPKIGTGRKDAIEYLAANNHNLSGLPASGVNLAYLRLPAKAQLQKADFRGSNLFQASITAANLAYSNFSNPANAKLTATYTNLHDINLSRSDLREAQFIGTFMKDACLRGAYLYDARFDQAKLKGSDFRGARGLKASQFSHAIGARQAWFDPDLARAIGASTAPGRAPSSCNLRPASRGFAWW